MRCGPHTYLLVLAGGEGVRFAPLSTPEHPKQFLQLVGDRSMIQHTVDRFADVIPHERIWVSTNHRYLPLIRDHLPDISAAHILAETEKKNTAPALALAAHALWQHDPRAILVAVPADHMITKPAAFHEAIVLAEQIASTQDCLVTLGVPPNRPATEYGYIERDVPMSARAFLVKRFVEKPDASRATAYLASGHFYWNSGIFVWTAQRFLAEVAAHLPQLAEILPTTTTPIHDARDFFRAAPSISVDYGILEKSSRVAVIPMDCGWSDVGSWQSLRLLAEETQLPLAPNIRTLIAQYA